MLAFQREQEEPDQGRRSPSREQRNPCERSDQKEECEKLEERASVVNWGKMKLQRKKKKKKNRWWISLTDKLRRWHFITNLWQALWGVSAWGDNSTGIIVPSLWQLSWGEAGPEAAQTGGRETSQDASYNLVTLSFIQRGKLLWISIINILVNFGNDIPIHYD